MSRSRHPFNYWFGYVLILAAAFFQSSRAAEILPPGFRPKPVGVHALVGGRVVLRPGQVLDSGTIVIRDGLIKAVGKDVTVPGEARVWDMKGTTIYAGFIEPYLMVGSTNAPITTTDTEPIQGTFTFTSPGQKFFGAPGGQTDLGNAGPGSEVIKITPDYRAVRDYSPKERVVVPLRELGFTVGLVVPSKGIIRGTSTLVALVEEDPNSVIIKGDVFQHLAFETHERDERAYPGSIMGAIATIRQSFLDAQHYAADHADYQKNPQNRKPAEFNPALEALLPVAERRLKVMYEPGSALMIDRAARLAAELGLDFCLVSSGQEWRRPDLAKATGAAFVVPLNFPTPPRMPSEDDWSQVTLDQLRAWDWAPENAALLHQQSLEVALTTYGLSDKKKFRSNLRLAMDRGFPETNAVAALTTIPARLCGVDKQLGTIEPGKLAYLTVVTGTSYFDPQAKVREVWIDGRIYRNPTEEPKVKSEEDRRTGLAASPEEGAPKKDRPATTPAEESRPEAKPDEKPKEEGQQLQKRRLARSPLEGRGVLAAPNSVVIRNATIWTCGEQGVLTNAQLLISDGKIKAIGNIKTELEGGMLQIEGDNLHITPGLIDCHNHSMILGSVNESTLPSTAMVRIRDVVNSESDHIYEQLAGGVTAVNLLHGSANPIGGQNCVIKLRDGSGPEDLVFEAAPRGIKFALGENVKQANWGERFTTRFPQTRMGVRTFIENRFTAARQYLREWENYRSNGGLPPRRDLELEALGEILEGKRWIHCHSYRQDEILAFIRLMESFKVKIGTLQHVLEGYKVADEIAQHGAGASTFSDWWAYKFEVYDAIPYNGALMHERGVVVSFNSDSSDLARRLYDEAAKAVKYGGVSESDALKFVTLNPAKQLRVEQRIGSLEPGKDGDFVIWSKSPLDAETVCLQTWIEGKKYFDRSMDEERTTKRVSERDELLARIKQVSRASGRPAETKDEPEEAFFRVSLEHEFDGRDRHCLDQDETTKGEH
jgi:imidazolonepropionase-like amidohydrolase